MTIHVALSLAGSGYHPASWQVSRLPAAPNARACQAVARQAEAAGVDAILLGIPVKGASLGSSGRVNTMQLDPLPLLGSMIAVTRHIGLGASWTVDFTEPYHVARVFATLDHLSYGRTGWIVDMFGTDALLPLIGKPAQTADVAAYCERAGEFIDVVRQLWDSWEDEAFALDKASGMFVDPDHVHPINHVGPYFQVRGPLNVPRPPQGNPVLIVEDPADTTARRFVANIADVILIDGPSVARCQELHDMAGGRDVRVLANIHFTLGETESAAQHRAATLDALAMPLFGEGRFIGTPARFAEQLADWHRQGGCDGFNLLPAVLPDDVDMLVIPQDGVRTTTTFRERLGLVRPRSQFAESAR